MSAAADAGTIDQTTAARLLRLTTARVGQLVKEGWIKREPNGRYLVPNVVHGYLDFLEDVKKRESRTASASRVQEERAALYRQQRLEKERRLVDLNESTAMLWESIGFLKAQFAGLPARVTKDKAIKKLIEAESDDAFNRAAAHFEQEAALLSATGGHVTPVAEDDA